MTKLNKAADFLENMKLAVQDQGRRRSHDRGSRSPGRSRQQVDTVEKMAVLRARLRLDNSQLIKLAVEELYAKHMAKRAFGDD
jgi:hypothetical protein